MEQNIKTLEATLAECREEIRALREALVLAARVEPELLSRYTILVATLLNIAQDYYHDRHAILAQETLEAVGINVPRL